MNPLPPTSTRTDTLLPDTTPFRSHERNLLTQIFRFFTQADAEVQDCYHDKYGRVFKPTEIKMMLTAFSNMETVHIAAYSHLLDTIGMPESEYGMFLQYKERSEEHTSELKSLMRK